MYPATTTPVIAILDTIKTRSNCSGEQLKRPTPSLNTPSLKDKIIVNLNQKPNHKNIEKKNFKERKIFAECKPN